MTQTRTFAQADLTQIVSCCQQERGVFRRAHDHASPACVELFRRAWAGDQEAWMAIQTIFEPLMRAWIGSQQAVEPDDVIQEALFAFARWAPRHAELLADDALQRPLAFLRRCTKTALLMQLRAAHRLTPVALEQADDLLQADIADAVELRLVLHERMLGLLTSPTEQLVFRELLVYDRRPQEIFQRYREHFADMAELRTLIQRILRRLRNDREIQTL